jgi:hypothetical protein
MCNYTSNPRPPHTRLQEKTDNVPLQIYGNSYFMSVVEFGLTLLKRMYCPPATRKSLLGIRYTRMRARFRDE